ncbi:MAG: hypothetical protein HY738_17985 [Bacteroidia bacterium]|nr:hypothetical protein [Bacteroidia bacterium]
MKIVNLFKKFYHLPLFSHLVIIFLISLIIRSSVSIVAYQSNIMKDFADDLFYLNYVNVIIEQGINFKSFAMSEYLVPGIGIVNYPFIYIFGNNWLMEKKTALLASIWSIFYVLHLKHVPTMGKELWMSLFMLLNIYLLLVIMDNFKSKPLKYQISIYLISSFIFAFSILFDERYFMFLMLFPLLILFLNKPIINGLKIASIYVLLTIIFLLPWHIRSYIRHDKIIILSKRTEKLTDKIFGYKNQNYEAMDDICSLYGRYYIHDYQIDSVINGYKKFTDGGYEITEDMRLEMKNGFLPHPFNWYESLWSRFKEFWRTTDFCNEYQKTGYYFNGKWSLKHNLSTFLSYGILLPFFILGLFELIKKKKKLFVILFSIIAFYCLIHVMYICFVTWRYRIPIDSIIIIIAFYYISPLLENLSIKKISNSH